MEIETILATEDPDQQRRFGDGCVGFSLSPRTTACITIVLFMSNIKRLSMNWNIQFDSEARVFKVCTPNKVCMCVYTFDTQPIYVVQAMYLPDNMGIGIGGEGEPNIYILAVRYDNERKLQSEYPIV